MPFTVKQFLDVFERYNAAVWPAQIVAYALGLAAIVLALLRSRYAGRVIAALLALAWLWMGVAYHLLFFTAINRLAYVFAALFVVQGVLFGWSAWRGTLSIRPRLEPGAILGALMMLYAMIVYPLLGAAAGHGWPGAPMFGITPCPTTIFTFGMLMWTDRRVPWYLPPIPVLWAVVGFFAALQLTIYEDIGLPVAMVAAGGWVLWRDVLRQSEPPARQAKPRTRGEAHIESDSRACSQIMKGGTHVP